MKQKHEQYDPSIHILDIIGIDFCVHFIDITFIKLSFYDNFDVIGQDVVYIEQVISQDD